MAPNKKKGGRTNNKKKKGQAVAPKSNTTSASSQPSPQSQASILRQIPKLPAFGGKNKDESAKAPDVGGYYEIYKRSTTRFWEWMKESLPNTKMVGVNDLRKGADSMLELNIASLDEATPHPIVAPKHILDDLSTSIHYRQLLTDTKYGNNGGDRGHKYMVDATLQISASVWPTRG